MGYLNVYVKDIYASGIISTSNISLDKDDACYSYTTDYYVYIVDKDKVFEIESVYRILNAEFIKMDNMYYVLIRDEENLLSQRTIISNTVQEKDRLICENVSSLLKASGTIYYVFKKNDLTYINTLFLEGTNLQSRKLFKSMSGDIKFFPCESEMYYTKNSGLYDSTYTPLKLLCHFVHSYDRYLLLGFYHGKYSYYLYEDGKHIQTLNSPFKKNRGIIKGNRGIIVHRHKKDFHILRIAESKIISMGSIKINADMKSFDIVEHENRLILMVLTSHNLKDHTFILDSEDILKYKNECGTIASTDTIDEVEDFFENESTEIEKCKRIEKCLSGTDQISSSLFPGEPMMDLPNDLISMGENGVNQESGIVSSNSSLADPENDKFLNYDDFKVDKTETSNILFDDKATKILQIYMKKTEKSLESINDLISSLEKIDLNPNGIHFKNLFTKIEDNFKEICKEIHKQILVEVNSLLTENWNVKSYAYREIEAALKNGDINGGLSKLFRIPQSLTEECIPLFNEVSSFHLIRPDSLIHFASLLSKQMQISQYPFDILKTFTNVLNLLLASCINSESKLRLVLNILNDTISPAINYNENLSKSINFLEETISQIRDKISRIVDHEMT